jgi:homoaconitate hydratase
MHPPLHLGRRYARTTFRKFLATVADERRIPQTVIEKVVQKYAVGLPQGRAVKAGDYVMIRPEHVMTHDNTGPVIFKCAYFNLTVLLTSDWHPFR